MTPFEHDTRLALEVCESLPVGFRPLIDAFVAGPVYFVAEGSSRLLPLGFLRSLARVWGEVCVDGSSGRLMPPRSLGTLVALSNSGRTREVAEAVHGRDYLAVCGTSDTPLGRSARSTFQVLPRPERAVASTAAVLGQTLALAESMALALGRVLHRADLRLALDELDLPTPPPTERLWIVGGDDGLAEELALKSWEMAGLPAAAVPAGLALHGLEEVLQARDLVWVLHSDSADLDPITQRLAPTGAQLLIPPLPSIGLLQPLLHLAAGWQVLAHLARSRGRDPGQPRRARKVGNAIDSP